MPAFLEHVFTFYSRDEPHMRSTFRAETYLHDTPPVNAASTPYNDNGLRIQHCFNLVGLEFDSSSSSEQFKYRQTAAYYSLDLSRRETAWVIIKGNAVIRESIQELTDDGMSSIAPLSTPAGAYMLGLKSHLLIFEWSIQNWTPYINSLHEQILELSLAAQYTPVSKMTEEGAIQKTISRMSTMHSETRQNSGLQHPQNGLSTWKDRIPLLHFISGSEKQVSHPAPRPMASKREREKGLGIGKVFPFKNLQRLHRQATSVQDGLLVLSQNKAVLQDMVHHFQRLQNHDVFRKHVKVDDAEFEEFTVRTMRCIKDLESHQSSLSALSVDLERSISLVSLQFFVIILSQISYQLVQRDSTILQYAPRRVVRSTRQSLDR